MEKTHNLEVPGSSPGWSTLKISNLEEIQVADFSYILLHLLASLVNGNAIAPIILLFYNMFC